MSSGIKKNLHRVVLDTNVLISAIVFGGKPRLLLQLVVKRELTAVISPILLAEFHEVISKKFPELAFHLYRIEKKMKKSFSIVHPKETIYAVRDLDDNRVIEAAVEGKCLYIVTGDIDLLELKTYQNIKIVTPDIFIEFLFSK